MLPAHWKRQGRQIPYEYLGGSRAVQDGEQEPKQHLKLHHVSREIDRWRLTALFIDGWETHAGQLHQGLGFLTAAYLTTAEELGPCRQSLGWGQTLLAQQAPFFKHSPGSAL